ncbi:hypothetical protein FQZ97_544240 [compost metagenome]
MFKYVAALAVVSALAGCAAKSEFVRPPSAEGPALSKSVMAKVGALSRDGKKVSYIYEVPQAGNAVSNALVTLASNAGAVSTSAEYLTGVLKLSRLPSMTVLGESDAVTAAAIESAIRGLQDAKTTTVIYFAGERSYVDRLRMLAGQAGVPLEATIYPE